MKGKFIMKKEELIELGLSEEVAEKVAKKSKDELKEYIPKSRLDEVINERDTYKGSLAERDKQLEQLKKNSGDSEELKTQIAEMQRINAEQIKAKDAEIAKIKLNNAVEKALAESKAKNTKSVMALLDLENAELGEDGAVKGLSEQIKKLQADEGTSFLFDVSEKKQEIKGATPTSTGSNAPTQTSEYASRLAEARKNGDTLSAIAIKREAMENGEILL